MLNTCKKENNQTSETPQSKANAENLQPFEYYLKDKGLAERTISENLKNLARFETWREENNLTPLPCATAKAIGGTRLGGAGGGLYHELLGYVQYMKNKGLSVPTQNIRINSIRKYYEHLKEEGTVEINPARRLRIKGAIKKVIVNPLSYTELEQLYHEYAKPKEHYREEKIRRAHEKNTVILGLMTGQAVHSGELGKMEVRHINLQNGTAYIPGTARSNGRELKLESRQIILLYRYIRETKPAPEKPVCRSPEGAGRLFECSPHDAVYHIVNELKGINPVIKNAQHIRASVILHWMRMYDKRTVQYMTGHKWISSTEHYEVQELTGLTGLLAKHHPFS